MVVVAAVVVAVSGSDPLKTTAERSRAFAGRGRFFMASCAPGGSRQNFSQSDLFWPKSQDWRRDSLIFGVDFRDS
jgi:hypothetical protein